MRIEYTGGHTKVAGPAEKEYRCYNPNQRGGSADHRSFHFLRNPFPGYS